MSLELRASRLSKTLSDLLREIDNRSNDAVLFLDYLDDIPLRVTNLEISNPLAVAVDGAGLNTACSEYVSHSFDLLTEENRCLACTCFFFCGEDNKVSVPFEMVGCGTGFLLNMRGLAEPEFILVPRTHGRNISNTDSQSIRNGKICRPPWDVEPSGCSGNGFYSIAMRNPKPRHPARIEPSARNEAQVSMRASGVE